MSQKQPKLSSFFEKKERPQSASIVTQNEWSKSNANDWMHNKPYSNSKEPDQHPAVAKKRVLPSSITRSVNLSNQSQTINSSSNSYSKQSTPNFDSYNLSKSSYQSNYSITSKNQTNKLIDLDETKNRDIRKTIDVIYKLSSSQKLVLDSIMQRKSVFYTGAAGTGKSYILKVLQDVLTELRLNNKIAFTAPTGVAACNIQGLTIHSWAGVGRASEGLEELLGIVHRNRNAVQRWRETDILVIDEISMLSSELLDKLDFIGRRLRNNLQPFGGIQVILCGDFFQLPPIGLGRQSSFCFESDVWKELFGSPYEPYTSNIANKCLMIELDKVFRQENDTAFLTILNEIRQGFVSQQSQNTLLAKVRVSTIQQEGTSSIDVKPTKLFSTNQDVDQYNLEELQRLSTIEGDDADPRLFQAVDEGREPYLNQLIQGTKAPKTLLLKKGAQVMLLKNLSTSNGLVNGARGIVIGFESSQGRSNYYPMLPVVKFQTIIGSKRNEEIITLTHDTWEIKSGEKVYASRVQIPLMLAWGISIHKSQGMTIPYLEVSFNRMFEYGQGYVALSRATSLEGLILKSFQGSCIKAHPKVKQFYQYIKQRKIQQFGNSLSDIVVSVYLKEFVKEFLEASNLPSNDELLIGNDENNDEGWIDAKSTNIRKPSNAIISKSISNPVAIRPPEPQTKPQSTTHQENSFENPILKNSNSSGNNNEEENNIICIDLVDDVGNLKGSTFPPESQLNIQNVDEGDSYGYGNISKINQSNVNQLANLSEDLKRKIEQNRLQALEKLKKRRAEDVAYIVKQYNL